ncbi:MAG: hypothetical protein VKJ64_06405, partial [Leptolyngbyaceae bacterium]|nr:hypothetical protein [Leptolyngbyaceae bacterium]
MGKLSKFCEGGFAGLMPLQGVVAAAYFSFVGGDVLILGIQAFLNQNLFMFPVFKQQPLDSFKLLCI